MRQLIFVYNADSSLFSQMTDYVHKIVSPDTYQCRLCALTYDNLGMKRTWKTFIESLHTDVVFLHKDEFHKQFKDNTHNLPAVFERSEDNTVTRLISKETLETMNTLDDLIEHVQHIV